MILSHKYSQRGHTTPLFDVLVKNGTSGDTRMLSLFIQLDKDSLQQTAYQRIHSTNPTSRILASQILSVTVLNPKTEELLKDAVINWEINLKGYAITEPVNKNETFFFIA